MGLFQVDFGSQQNRLTDWMCGVREKSGWFQGWKTSSMELPLAETGKPLGGSGLGKEFRDRELIWDW